jgi:hypothetical protein
VVAEFVVLAAMKHVINSMMMFVLFALALFIVSSSGNSILCEGIVLPMPRAPAVSQHIWIFDVSQAAMRVQRTLVVCDVSLVRSRAYGFLLVRSCRNSVVQKGALLSNFWVVGDHVQVLLIRSRLWML